MLKNLKFNSKNPEKKLDPQVRTCGPILADQQISPLKGEVLPGWSSWKPQGFNTLFNKKSLTPGPIFPFNQTRLRAIPPAPHVTPPTRR